MPLMFDCDVLALEHATGHLRGMFMKALGYAFILLLFVGCWIVWQIVRRASAGAQAVINPERYAIQKVVEMQQGPFSPELPPRLVPVPEHSQRWDALVRYDPDIAKAADELRPYGIKWVDELGRAYFALREDKQYLADIVLKLKGEGEQEREEEHRRREEEQKHHRNKKFSPLNSGEDCTDGSLRVLRRAEALGYLLTVQFNGTIEATRPGKGTSYFHSNIDIQHFGKFL